MKTKFNLLKTLLALGIVLATAPLFSQTWQWAKKGGATDALGNTTEHEEVKSMCTDSYGNVYVTSYAGRVNLRVDGHPKDTYSVFGLNDAVLSAFSCDGAYKWSKVIGGAYGVITPIAVGSDNLGNVYATGVLYRTNILPAPHFDSDLVLPTSPSVSNTYKQTIYLVKYDKNGTLLWLRQPQAANISSTDANQSYVSGIDVDSQGNSYIFCKLSIGVYGEGQYTVTTSGHYVLQYDINGNFLGGINLNIQTTGGISFNMKRDHNSGAIYVSGEVPQGTQSIGEVYINGELITKSLFVAAYSSTGSFLWKRENAGFKFPGGNANYNYLAVDEDGAVYFSSKAIYLTNGAASPPDGFNGVPFTDPTATPVVFITKLDASGNTIWQTNSGGMVPTFIAVNGEEVAITGSARVLHWQTFDYQQDANSGTHPFLVRFNKETGGIIAINAVYTNGSDAGTALATDSKGNYYMGGKFSGILTAGPSTLNCSGGGTDFFVAKFGTDDCDFLATTQPVKNEIRVYPNPVKGILHIDGFTGTKYTLYDMRGVVVQMGAITNKTINIESIAVGVYILEVDGVKIKVLVD